MKPIFIYKFISEADANFEPLNKPIKFPLIYDWRQYDDNKIQFLAIDFSAIVRMCMLNGGIFAITVLVSFIKARVWDVGLLFFLPIFTASVTYLIGEYIIYGRHFKQRIKITPSEDKIAYLAVLIDKPRHLLGRRLQFIAKTQEDALVGLLNLLHANYLPSTQDNYDIIYHKPVSHVIGAK
jgi:hypothetical protein